MVYFTVPKFEELVLRKELVEDYATMCFNHAHGGTIDFNCDKWILWYDKWVLNPKRKFYRYVYNESDSFIGEACIYFDEYKNRYMLSIILAYEWRKKGYGCDTLELLLREAKENGIQELYDEIESDNSAILMFLKRGFTVESISESTILVKIELK